jgi:hypothetical protein
MTTARYVAVKLAGSPIVEYRARQVDRKEQEKPNWLIREKVEEEARNRMCLDNMSQLEIKAEERRKEFENLLYDKEDGGLIRIERRK